MKVLQLHNTYLEAGGEDGVVLRERELLTERRHQVETIQFQNPEEAGEQAKSCLLYTSPSPRDLSTSRMPSSA